MIIDATYFHGDINLPAQPTNQEDVLTSYISKYEKKYLKALLGDDLAAEFIDGYEEDPRPAIWQSLADAMISDVDLLLSPIANYVYYYWVQNEASFRGLLGEITPNTENGQVILPTFKMIQAWNEMKDWNEDVIEFIEANISDYGSYDVSNQSELINYKNSFNI